MKFSTIIRAILAPLVQVHAFDDRISIWTLRAGGAGIALSTTNTDRGHPARAKHVRVGDLHVRYWGRDTMVHHAPEAS